MSELDEARLVDGGRENVKDDAFYGDAAILPSSKTDEVRNQHGLHKKGLACDWLRTLWKPSAANHEPGPFYVSMLVPNFICLSHAGSPPLPLRGAFRHAPQ